MHEVIGKNGRVRGTTIADARKLLLVPSVTTVFTLLAKPQLTDWIIDQTLNAAIEVPFHPEGYEPTEWKALVTNMSYKIGRDAANKGSAIHHQLDLFFKTGEITEGYECYIGKVLACLNTFFPGIDWVSEESFAHSSGFGGCVDLHSKEGIIIDFKTKDKSDIKAVKSYEEHRMQLAAYQLGLELPTNTRRFNLFVSTAKGVEGDCNLVECKQFEKYSNMFVNLLAFWKAKNSYDASFGDYYG